MEPSQLIDAYGAYAATFVVAVVSGFLPMINTEAYLLFAAAWTEGWQAACLVLVASAGQMTSKSVLFLSARAGLHGRVSSRPWWPRWLKPRTTADLPLRVSGARLPLLLTSSFCGLPPFYGLTLVAGALGWPYLTFAVIGALGRLVRFGLVVMVPQLVREIAS